MTETAVTITTYDADTNKVLEGSSAYTIVKKADTTALNEAVEAAKKQLEAGKYTDESVAKVNEAIKNTETIIADDQSTSDKIAEATAYLNEAVAALEVKPEEPAGDDTSKDDTSSDTSTPDDTSSDTSKPDDTSKDDVSTPDDTSKDDVSTPDDTSSDVSKPDDTSSDTSKVDDTSKADDNITNPNTGNMVSVAPFAALSALSAFALAGMVVPEAIKNKKSSK